MEIIVFNLENDQDLVLAHRRSMQLGEMCGLNLVAQTTFATAVSEVARFMIENGGDSRLTLSLNKPKDKRPTICASINSPLLTTLNIANENFKYAKKLAGHFEVSQNEVSVSVDLTKAIHLTKTFTDSCKQAFKISKSISPYDEVKRKNTELQQLADNLVDSENRYQELTGSLPLMMFTLAADHYMVYANKWFLDFTGKSLHLLRETNWLSWVMTQHLDVDIKDLQVKLEEQLPFQLEINLSVPTGRVWHLLSMTPQTDARGVLKQWFGFIVNIDAQKLVDQTLRDNQELRLIKEEMEVREKQLDDTIIELNRSNQELARYAYVASHDLQEPIRKARLLADMVMERYKDQLPPEGIDLLSRLKSSSERMHLVVTDLLDYSRINSGPVPLNERVELSKIIELAMASLEYLINEKDATVIVSYNCPIAGNAAQLILLFENLIANAIKFTAPEVKPIVTIDVEFLNQNRADVLKLGAGRQWLKIQITDNGIGFEEKYVERIFEVFQRLHPQKQYEGSGIGLSICKKIVELHGGIITAESSPGKGSTFIVYLPGYKKPA